MNLFDISGKKALVTGSGNGIGLGLAEGLLEAGATVVLSSLSDSAVRAAEEFRKKGYDAHAVTGDLSSEADTRMVFEKSMELLGGRMDILVNNAGAQHREATEDFSLEAFDYVMNVNIRNIFVISQLAGRHMLERGYGKIVNIASMQSFFGTPRTPAYAASKGGIAQLTKAMGNEWLSRGININAIAPGWIETQMIKPVMEDPVRSKEVMGRIPAGRWGKPSDLKGAVIFLSSAASDYLSGVILPVDGGFLTR